jgi:hypothetical protein
MSDLSKNIGFFIVAAACGGGVAYFAGFDKPVPRLQRPSAMPDQSKTVLPTDDWQDKNPLELTTATSPINRTQSVARVPSASQLSINEGGLPVKTQDSGMLELLRSIKHSSHESPASEDKNAQQRLQTALEEMRKHLRKSELARAIVSRRETEGIISTMVKIAPPSANEINMLRELLTQLQTDLPPQQQVQFQNQCLILLRQFIFDQDKAMVVFITQQFAHAASKSGNFHSHLTTKPDDYWHHHNGEQVGVPHGETTLEGGPISMPLSPDFRYYHLASVP